MVIKRDKPPVFMEPGIMSDAKLETLADTGSSEAAIELAMRDMLKGVSRAEMTDLFRNTKGTNRG